jgi:hypothetical protein
MELRQDVSPLAIGTKMHYNAAVTADTRKVRWSYTYD